MKLNFRRNSVFRRIITDIVCLWVWTAHAQEEKSCQPTRADEPVEIRKMIVESLTFHSPSLQEVAQVLETALLAEFFSASVRVVESPDLTKAPFYLASKGLSGRPSIVHVGGLNNLVPCPLTNKIYNINDVAERLNYPGGLLVGVGAVRIQQRDRELACELIANVKTRNENKEETNLSFGAIVDEKTGSPKLIPINTSDVSFLLQGFISDGKPGQVLEVTASRRRMPGKKSFVSVLREGLSNYYNPFPMGLGGVFVLAKGLAKVHVLPGLHSVPLNESQFFTDWLEHFNLSAPLVCFPVIVTHDAGLQVQLEHTHCFSDHGVGGHYYQDVSPDEAKYFGYFSVAQKLYRIDRTTK